VNAEFFATPSKGLKPGGAARVGSDRR
jgi:hypothetical protein